MTIKITNKDCLDDVEILNELIAELMEIGNEMIYNFESSVEKVVIFEGKKINIRIFKE